MRRLTKRACALAGAAVLGLSGWAFADHFSATWTTNGVGGWTNPINWSTITAYPDNGADTFDATIALAAAQVILTSSVTINDFNLSAGTLTGGGTVNVNGTALWEGGHLRGMGAININDTLVIDGTVVSINHRTLNIAPLGYVDWVSGGIDAPDESGAGGGGTINNQGVWNDQTDATFTWWNDLSPVINNTGFYLKTAGTEDFLKSVWAAFNNDGSVEVQVSGMGLHLAGGGHHTGSFTVAAGATLGFSDFNAAVALAANAPTTTFAASSVISSQGTVLFGIDPNSVFGNATTSFAGTVNTSLMIIDMHDPNDTGSNNGRITFESGAAINTGSITPHNMLMKSGTARFETGQGSIYFNAASLTGGMISTTDTMAFDTLFWSSGTIAGDEVIAESGIGVTTGSLQFSGTAPKVLQDVTFFNGVDSVATISEGSLSMIRAEWRNLGGSTFDISGPVVISNDGPSNDGTVFVIGPTATLLKSAGAGSAEFQNLMVNNDGLVQAMAGTLRLNGGGFHTGQMAVSAGATLELGGGGYSISHQFQDDSILSGDPGSTVHVTGPVRLEYGSTLAVDALNLNGGFIDYDGGGFFAGALSMDNGSQIALSPNADKILLVKSVSIVQFSESAIDLSNNKMIVDYDVIDAEAEPVAATIRQYIAAGYNGGGWDGEGIFTSLGNSNEFGLGYADNSVLGLEDFGGYGVDADSVLLKYTYFGDANLDGMVDVRDLLMLANGWLGSGLWTDGDFNYDGLIDQIDLTLLAQNWQSGNGAPLSTALEGVGLPVVSVPEPVGLGLIASLAFPFRRPRRR